jgi:hypothetical protein|eukprot:COSAG06_NODE_17401_length_943_cov_1.297393_2_plen_79_part_00
MNIQLPADVEFLVGVEEDGAASSVKHKKRAGKHEPMERPMVILRSIDDVHITAVALQHWAPAAACTYPLARFPVPHPS